MANDSPMLSGMGLHDGHAGLAGGDFLDDTMEEAMAASSSAMSIDRLAPPLGRMGGLAMRGMLGLRRQRSDRSDRQSAVAARVANLVDEHGHGLLMQMLQVCVYVCTWG